MKFIKKLKINFYLFIALFLFSILYLPFLESFPYLDGNIDFVQSYHFLKGGFKEYFNNWTSVHPPFKVFISSLFFKFLGFNVISYNLIGYFFGLISILYFNKLAFLIFDSRSAKIATILLATSPLFLATAIFSLRDFLLTSFLILSLYFYLVSNYFFYLFFSTLSFLSKESGLLLIVCVILIEFFSFLKNKKNSKFLITLSGLTIPFLWWFFLKINQKTSWRDWLFSEYASKGTYYVMIKNLLELKIFNQYAYQHWLHLFILNFNWIFWLIFLIGFFWMFIKKYNIFLTFLMNFNQKAKTVLVIVLLIISYFLTVLCLPTYAIPRYILPILPFLYLLDSYIIQLFLIKKKRLFSFFINSGMIVLIFLSLFFSLDPLSLKIWGKIKIFGKKFYALNEHFAGNDGITYNFQYLYLIKERTKKILEANNKKDSVVSEDCYWIFPDPRNDFQTIQILKLNGINLDIPCREIKVN
ncbi:MAG: ArnT family glycosyltransferase [Microgenomates group bacterium]